LFIATITLQVVPAVYGYKTSAQVWTVLAARYASPFRSHATQLRRQLQALRQGSKSCIEFIRIAKSLSNQLAIFGNITTDDDLISYIVGGLSPAYNAFVMTFSMLAKDKSMTLEDFQSQLLGHEQLLEHQAATTEHTSFAMFSQRTPAKPKYNSNFKKSSNPGSFNRNFQSNPPKKALFIFFMLLSRQILLWTTQQIHKSLIFQSWLLK
jgi:hypothetical protein